MRCSPIFDDWVWSYSRLRLFEQCPYAFAQRYLYQNEGVNNFYAEYGSLVHKVLEQWYKGELGTNESTMASAFVRLFQKYINAWIDSGTRAKYFMSGLEYFNGGVFAPPFSSILAVEKRLNFNVGDYRFVGVIDLVYRNPDGTVTILDHKSHNLRPRSGRKKPTKYDEELDSYLTQLYLYAHALRMETGDKVSTLQFNCFKNRILVSEAWTEDGEKHALEWAENTIKAITECTDFEARPDFFYCKNLCESRQDCEYNE